MKKNILPLIIVVLVVAQFVSIMKISSLQQQVDNARAEISTQDDNTRSEINEIYANVDEMLKKEASLIETASIKVGDLDTENFTAPITFAITPKEVSANTAVSLEIDGQLNPMTRNGTTFSTTVSRGIFGKVSPMIVIDESGVKKTTQDDRIVVESMKDLILPILSPQFIGETSYSRDTYQCKKTLYADVKNAESGIAFTDMRFVIKVDKKVISNEVIPSDAFSGGWQVDKSIQLKKGQTCIMMVIATDSIGLEHRYTVEYWRAGADDQRGPRFDEEQIYAADGKLLWKAE
ncbi:hypothetical protein Ami103574_10325 [Aminipila butyrica]|uniref:Uncharacterized protein n=1 Tax=Aminipila butyrica TaxID=433296 RepID=A0A858BUT3_9FIRM|nr:hypothetical protein [Aminipila butyrica]QIB69693.1 hypothetical protein Ami103574_10325 [Aminipila butyrica]